MNNFGECAVLAANILRTTEDIGPTDAWAMAARRIFPNSMSSQKKVCPKKAFEGLCEGRKIKEIDEDKIFHARASKNGDYAVEGLKILSFNPALASNPRQLLKQVLKNLNCDEGKAANGQMEVVIALFNEGVLET